MLPYKEQARSSVTSKTATEQSQREAALDLAQANSSSFSTNGSAIQVSGFSKAGLVRQSTQTVGKEQGKESSKDPTGIIPGYALLSVRVKCR